ncbi:MAG: M56 family metallopeptidase [Candidatus Promineifilaceae bacterium]
MAKRSLSYRASAASFALALACLGLAGLCGWLIAQLLHRAPLQLLCCRLNEWHAALMGALPGLHLWPLGLSGLLLIGAVAMMRQTWRTSRHLRPLLGHTCSEMPLPLGALLVELKLEAHLVLAQTDAPLAFCFGLWRPRICLSTGLLELLSPTQLKAALWHEEHHRRRFDPLRLLLIETARAMFFFLPAVREWGELAKIRLELAADSYAVQHTGKSALAGALHLLLARESVVPVAAGSATAGLSANAARIADLLGERFTPQQISPHSLLRSAVVILLLCPLLML